MRLLQKFEDSNKNRSLPLQMEESMALWDGRFTGGPAEEMQQFGESLSVDLLMWEEDILGSKAHSTMLYEVGLLTQEEMAQIHQGLDQVA